MSDNRLRPQSDNYYNFELSSGLDLGYPALRLPNATAGAAGSNLNNGPSLPQNAGHSGDMLMKPSALQSAQQAPLASSAPLQYTFSPQPEPHNSAYNASNNLLPAQAANMNALPAMGSGLRRRLLPQADASVAQQVASVSRNTLDVCNVVQRADLLSHNVNQYAVSNAQHYMENISRSTNVSCVRQAPAAFLNNYARTTAQHTTLPNTSQMPSGTAPRTPAGNSMSNVIQDQFGLLGLEAGITAARNNPNLGILNLGIDLNELGIDVDLGRDLNGMFGGPFATCSLSSLDTESNDPVPPINLFLYNDDRLFGLFYTKVGKPLQKMSATELYRRGWRFICEKRVWAKRAPGQNYTRNGFIETGIYIIFNDNEWRQQFEKLQVNLEGLDTCPDLDTFKMLLTG